MCENCRWRILVPHNLAPTQFSLVAPHQRPCYAVRGSPVSFSRSDPRMPRLCCSCLCSAVEYSANDTRDRLKALKSYQPHVAADHASLASERSPQLNPNSFIQFIILQMIFFKYPIHPPINGGNRLRMIAHPHRRLILFLPENANTPINSLSIYST